MDDRGALPLGIGDGAVDVDGSLVGGPASTRPVASLSFDEALAELQRTVAALEQGGLPLERTLELYELGAALHARCAMLLDEAELRIRRVAEERDGTTRLVDEEGDGQRSAGPDGSTEEA